MSEEVFNIQAETENEALNRSQEHFGDEFEFEVLGYTPAPADHGGGFFTLKREQGV